MNHRWGVVFGVFTRPRWVGENGCTQHVIRVHVCTAHAFVNHVGQAHVALPLHIHADFNEYRNNTRVLANRAMPFCTHAGVDQNLGDGIFCRWGFFTFPCFVHGFDEIDRMVIGNKLQRICNAGNYVILLNDSHDSLRPRW